MSRDDRDTKHPTSGKPQRTGEEAPYTSEAFEVNSQVGTDSPLDGPDGEAGTTRPKKA